MVTHVFRKISSQLHQKSSQFFVAGSFFDMSMVGLTEKHITFYLRYGFCQTPTIGLFVGF
jgi:hypothetical protein